jgi:putative transposase
LARLSRVAAPGLPHFVRQRGRGPEAVFADPEDRRLILRWLREAAEVQAVAVHAYVLLPGEVMLVATPSEAGALGRALQSAGGRYARHYNRRHGLRGALWDGRFRACVLDPDAHLLAVMRHVEAAPLRAGLVAEADAYPWSSLAHHLGLVTDPLVSEPAAYWALGNTPFERQARYRAGFDPGPPAEFGERLMAAANRGWPLGDAAFLRALKAPGQRPLRPGVRGRPRKTTQIQ